MPILPVQSSYVKAGDWPAGAVMDVLKLEFELEINGYDARRPI